MAHQTLVVILIAIAVIAFTAPLPARIGKASERPIRDDTCRASVETKSTFNLGILGSPLSLKCVEEDIKSRAKSKDQIKLEIATEMYSCWYKYGEGKADIYGSLDAWQTNLHCKICSFVQFPDVDEAPTYGELNDYLNTKKLPGKDITFAEYFIGEENSRIQLGGPGVTQKTKIDLAKSLYVIYTVAKFDDEKIKELREFSDRTQIGGEGINDQTSVTVDNYVVAGTAVAVVAAAVATVVTGGLFVLVMGIGAAGTGTAAYHSFDTDAAYYSVALFTTDDIVEVCDDFS